MDCLYALPGSTCVYMPTQCHRGEASHPRPSATVSARPTNIGPYCCTSRMVYEDRTSPIMTDSRI